MQLGKPEEPLKRKLSIEVEDMGPGISTVWHYLSACFAGEPFQQRNSMRSDVGRVSTPRTISVDHFESPVLTVEGSATRVRDAFLGEFPGLSAVRDIDLVELTNESLPQRCLTLWALACIPIWDGHTAVRAFVSHIRAIVTAETGATGN